MLLRILLLSLVAGVHFVNSENHEVEEIESVQLIGQADGDETPDGDEFEAESDRVEQVLTDREGVPPPSLDGDKFVKIPVEEVDDGVVNAGLGLVVSNSNKWLPKRTLSFKVASAVRALEEQDEFLTKQIFKIEVKFNSGLKDAVICKVDVEKTTKIEIITVDIWKWKITKTSYSTSGSCLPASPVAEPITLADSPNDDANNDEDDDEPAAAKVREFRGRINTRRNRRHRRKWRNLCKNIFDSDTPCRGIDPNSARCKRHYDIRRQCRLYEQGW